MASATLAAPCINPSLSHASYAVETSSSNPRGDEFSLYFSLIRESFPLELGSSASNLSSLRVSSGRKRNDDGEIGIFGAEKYFSGRMDGSSQPMKKVYTEEGDAGGKSRPSKSRSGTGSTGTCSESSGNSQSTLLRDRSRFPPPPTRPPNHGRGKGFLGVFGCSCSRKKPVAVDGDVVAGDPRSRNGRSGDRGGESMYKGEMGCRKMDGMSSGLKREEEPPFPNSNPVAGKVTIGSHFGSPFMLKDDVGSSRWRSLGLLSSAAIAAGGGAGRKDDPESDSSSDLFEIESLTFHSPSFFRTDTATESSTATPTCYEPSEASIEWSVATASAANFSVASEYNEQPSARGSEAKKPSRQHRPGRLLGCVSNKAVEATPAFDRREGLRMESSPAAARYKSESYRVIELESARARRGRVPSTLARAGPARSLYTHGPLA